MDGRLNDIFHIGRANLNPLDNRFINRLAHNIAHAGFTAHVFGDGLIEHRRTDVIAFIAVARDNGFGEGFVLRLNTDTRIALARICARRRLGREPGLFIGVGGGHWQNQKCSDPIKILTA